jgi:uncharacterized protein YbaP (TraB family)
MRHSTLVILSIIFCQQFAATPLIEAIQRYRALSEDKALAAVFGADPIFTVKHGKASTTQAASGALEQCERQRLLRGITQVCEIIRLNDTAVSTAATIKSNIPEPHPLIMWRYSTKSTDLFLVGSIHVLKAALYPLPKPMEAAFLHANHIVVEVNTLGADPRELVQKTIQHARFPENTLIEHVLTEEQFVILRSALLEQEIPYTNVSFFKPGILATQLAVFHLAALGYLPNFGMESYFLARSFNKTVHELETIESQFELLSTLPLDVQVEMLMETLVQIGDVESLISKMAHTWFAGEVEEFSRLLEMQPAKSNAYRKFVSALIDERNVAMSKKIGEFLNTPGTYFVLVGSAHLSGPRSIVALLDAQGFSSHRVMSNEVIKEHGEY